MSYDMRFVANLPLRPTLKEFSTSANMPQSYEPISSGTFFMDQGVLHVHIGLCR